MLASLITLFAFLTVGLTSAIPSVSNEVTTTTTSTDNQYPEGFFTGSRNADGTTTLRFPETNQTFTVEESPPTTVGTNDEGSVGLKKRAWVSCWGGDDLNRQGVDRGINEFRALFRRRPREQGFLGGKWQIQHFGYNYDGVFVYFCANTKDWYYSDGFDLGDLEWALREMDDACGPYRPGYYNWNSPSIWGKCTSGTPICLA